MDAQRKLLTVFSLLALAQTPLAAIAQGTSTAELIVPETSTSPADDAASDAENEVAKAAAEAASAAADAAAEAEYAEAAPEVSIGELCANPATSPAFAGKTSGIDMANLAEPIRDTLSGAAPIARRFTIGGEGGEIRLEARSQNQGDPALTILDGAQNTIETNDDSAQSLNPSITTRLEPGTYCAVVTELRGDLDAVVQLASPTQESLLPGGPLACGATTATTLLSQKPFEAELAKGPISAEIKDASRPAYFRFEVKSGQPMSLLALGDEAIDPQIALFDAQGASIATNDDADGRNSRLDFEQGLPPGSYCVGAGPVGESESTGKIVLRVEKLDPVARLRAAQGRGEIPPMAGDGSDYPVKTLRFGRDRSDVVMLGSSAVWFEFNLTERSAVTLRTLGSVNDVDTKLALFDSNAQVIAENDDSDHGSDAQITPMVLQPGRYLVALTISGSDGSDGKPLRPVVLQAERFVAQDD